MKLNDKGDMQGLRHWYDQTAYTQQQGRQVITTCRPLIFNHYQKLSDSIQNQNWNQCIVLSSL